MYANKQDIAEYLAVAEDTLPFDIDRLLRRASELIEDITMNRVDSTPEIAKKATCAQVEYWMNLDESMDILGAPDSIRIGDFSTTQKFAVLAPRAHRLLFAQGFLSRRVVLG